MPFTTFHEFYSLCSESLSANLRMRYLYNHATDIEIEENNSFLSEKKIM